MANTSLESLPDGSTVVPVILSSDKSMHTTPSGAKLASLVYLRFGTHSKVKRQSVKTNELISIGYLLKCAKRPKTHTNVFTYDKIIAIILGTLEEPPMSRLVVLCQECHTHHAFPRIVSFLADYQEQSTRPMVKDGWCPSCEICPDDMPSFACRPRHHHRQWYIHLSITAAEAVSLWKFSVCSNLANIQAG
jgi:hypothetical protein